MDPPLFNRKHKSSFLSRSTTHLSSINILFQTLPTATNQLTPPCSYKLSSSQPPITFVSSTAKMVKWENDDKYELLRCIVEHLNPGAIPWDAIAAAMDSKFSSQACR